MMAIPHFQTLYVSRVTLNRDGPTVAELGRLHFNRSEIKQLIDQGKKDKRQMAFGLVKKSELPVTTIGKVAATYPRIGISGVGRIQFNSWINKLWKNVNRIVILHDKDERKIAFIGLTAEQKCKLKGYDEKESFIPTIGKPNGKGKGGGEYYVAASAFLKLAGYDYTKAGNQAFDATAETIATMPAFVLTLPKDTPTARPPVERKKKVPATATTPATTVPVNTAPPSQGELLTSETDGVEL